MKASGRNTRAWQGWRRCARPEQRGEKFDEPVVAVLTSSGLKDVPATSIVSSSTARPSLDDVIASLRQS